MPALDPFQRDALTFLYWHRLLATDQIRRLVTPTGSPATRRRKLAALRAAGLVACVDREHRDRTWYVTSDGATLVEASGAVDARPYRVASPAVARMLGDHALDVAETGLAFVETAREHGDECGPLSWTPEVAHHFQRHGSARGVVIADAVLHYVLTDSATTRRSQRAFFVELDRATMPVARLAQKLVHYVRYHDYIPPQVPAAGPAWRQRYPRFPRVLIVLSGAGEHVLERRLADLRAHTQALAVVATAGDRVGILATTLRRLQTQGALADIAVPMLGASNRATSVFVPLTTGTK
jgi:hypothetical protein